MGPINHGDIYKIMDDAGLNASTFHNSKKSMATIVSEVRMKLLNELTAYIKQREEQHGSTRI